MLLVLQDPDNNRQYGQWLMQTATAGVIQH